MDTQLPIGVLVLGGVIAAAAVVLFVFLLSGKDKDQD